MEQMPKTNYMYLKKFTFTASTKQWDYPKIYFEHIKTG